MTELQTELLSKSERLKWKGKRNYIVAYGLYTIAAVSSATATIYTAALAVSKHSPSLWLAVITAVPAASVLLNDTLKLELKGRWCYEKRAALLSMLRQSRYAGVTDKEITAQWNILDVKMEREWPRFGTGVSTWAQRAGSHRSTAHKL